MSVSDPLLKELKAHIIAIRINHKDAFIHDQHLALQPLCQTLEAIFKKGLKTSVPIGFGRSWRDYWHWIEALHLHREQRRTPIAICNAIEYVLDNKKVFQPLGRGRLYIRTALARKLLLTTVEELLREQHLLLSFYDPQNSILGNEILSEIFLSLLHELRPVSFKLTLKNASFLDETWKLPVYKLYEFVPCRRLGIMIGYCLGRAVVVDVDKGSVAGEEDQVEIGDVIDELYGESLYRCRRGLVASLMNEYEGLPVYVGVIKCRYPTGELYIPLREHIIQLRLHNKSPALQKFLPQLPASPEKIMSGKSICEDCDKISLTSKSSKCIFSVLFIGVCPVGKEGRVCHIEKGISDVLSRESEQVEEPQKVMLEIGEAELIMYEETGEQALGTKHFTAISSCGRRTDNPEYFAYIAGETSCNMAEEFVCYVFKAESEEESRMILSGIARGFTRTKWVV